MGLKGVNVDATEATFMSDFLAQQVRAPGQLEVVTQTELVALLGLERQKQLLGCADSGASCLAELSGALGVDAVISGSAAKLGDAYAMTVSLVQTNGKVLGSWSEKLKGSADALDWLKGISGQVRDSALGLRGPAPGSGVKLSRVLPWVVVGAGVVATAAGVGLQVSARSLAASIANRSASIAPSQVDGLISGGKSQELVANLCLAFGVAAIVGGLVWWLLQ